jgi:hypothetical protein
MEKTPKTASLKGKILYTLKILIPVFLGISLSHATRGLEALWEQLPSLLVIHVVLGSIVILGWYLGDYLQNKK